MADGKVVIQFVGKDSGAKASADALANTLQALDELTKNLTRQQAQLNQEQVKGAVATKQQATSTKELQTSAQASLATQKQLNDLITQRTINLDKVRRSQELSRQVEAKTLVATSRAQQQIEQGEIKLAALKTRNTQQDTQNELRLAALKQQNEDRLLVSAARRDQQLASIAQRQQTQAQSQQIREQRGRVQEGTQTSKLATSLGIDVRGAQQFTQQLNLTAAATNTAIKRLQELDKAGATTKDKFAALSTELGVTKNQFLALESAAQKAAQVKAAQAPTTKGTIDLAKDTGKNFTQAQQFAGSLGLTADKASQAIQKLRELDAVGASNAQKFVVLNKELGVSKSQFEQLDRAAKQSKEGMQALATGAGALGAAIGAIAVKGLGDFAQFDKTIRNIGVVTETSGTPALAALRGEVERLGLATTKTPQEIAQVALELGKAGFTAEQTKQALAGVVQSSEATGEGLTRTGEVIGAALNQFGLGARDSVKVADLLTQASNVSAAGTNDLGEALSYVGAQAKASDQSIEDTVTTLALLANSGIKGSSAGTGLAEALRRLKLASASATTELTDLRSRGSKTAVAAFERLDGAVRNADGSLKPFPQILQTVKGSLNGLEQTNQDLLLNALFGVQGGRVIQSLLNQTSDQVSQVTDKMQNFSGASGKASQEMTKGLPGGLAIFTSSVALVSQKVGEFAAVGVAPIVDGANQLLAFFLGLPGPIQNGLLAVTGFAGALAAAVAVMTAYKLANAGAIAQQALASAATLKDTIVWGANTAAIIANNLAKTGGLSVTGLFAAAQATAAGAITATTGALSAGTAATGGFLASLLPALPLLLAIGGAAAAVYAIADTFTSVGKAAEPTTKATEDLKKKLDEINQTKVKVEGTEALKSDMDRVRESIGPVQNAFDVLREKIGLATAAQVAFNNAKISMGDLISQVEGVVGSYEAFARGNDRSKEAIDRQRAALEAAKASLAASQPVDEAGKAAKEEYTKAIERNLAQLNRIEAAANGSAAATTKAAKADETAAESAEKKAEALKKAREAEKEASDRAFEKSQKGLERGFEDSQTKRQNTFDDAKAKREAAFDDQKRNAEFAFQQAKEQREAAFKSAQQVKDAAYESQKQAKEQAFKAQQDAVKREFDKQQQAKEAAFNKSQQDAEAKFKDEQEKKQKAQEKEFKGAGDILDQRGAANDPEKLAKLQRSQRTQQNVDALKIDGSKKYNAQDIANLAQQTSGAGDLTNPEELAAAKEAQAAIEAKIKEEQRKVDQEAEKAFKEEQRAEEVAFKEQQKADELAFTQQQQAAETAFKEAERAADLAHDQQKQAAELAFKQQEETREKAFKDQQVAQDRANKQQELDLERKFKEEQLARDRQFKDEQLAREQAHKDAERAKDEASAKQIEDLKKAGNDAQQKAAQDQGTAANTQVQAAQTQLQAANAKPNNQPDKKPPGRRLGGPVEAGSPYMVGESGPELIFPSYSGYVVTAQQTQSLLNQARAVNNIAPTGGRLKSREELLLAEISTKLDKLGAVGGAEVQAQFNQYFSGTPDLARSESGRSVRDEAYEALDNVIRQMQWRQRWG